MQLTMEELRKRLRQRLDTDKREFATKTLHLLERPLRSGTALRIGPNQYDVLKDAFLVIVDEDPGAYWTHPVRYELHEVATGDVRVMNEQYPIESPDVKAELVALHLPDLPLIKKREEEGFPKAGPLNLAEIERQLAQVSFGIPLAQSNTRHALFIAGMDNMPDFHNDFVIMRDILIDRYGYQPSNIVIALGDGTGYPDLPADHAGDQAGIEAALDAFGTGGSHALGAGDTLFLYTFNHGGVDATGAFLCLPGWLKYYDQQLRVKLDNIKCGQLLVAMNQCNSGGFVGEVVATTGPAQTAIMTACSEDQSAHPSAGGGAHGYFSVALATALNWAFPSGVGATFPGHAAGPITIQDANNDGLVSAEDAWHYVQDMMTANHSPTIMGNETPQWGESTAGAGSTLFWGLPDIRIEDGAPWWESPDVFLHDPMFLPDDATAAGGHPANWGDYYHPDEVNRVVARIHNSGCAPARNLTVEFRAMSFGAGGGTNLIGTYPIVNIDPGEHAYAYVDWNFSSALVHRCLMARADCAGDAALPFGSTIDIDDNQAQRNLDPLFAAPGEFAAGKQVIERKFLLRNQGLKEAAFIIVPLKGREKSRLINAVFPEQEKRSRISLKPGGEKELTIRLEISPDVKPGEKLHFPVEVRRLGLGRATIGGVTFTVEVAEGRLEGRLVSRQGVFSNDGTVRIENTKQTNLRYTAKIGPRGSFSFPHIVPGPYRIHTESGGFVGNASVFVAPNRVTTKVLAIEPRILPRVVRAVTGQTGGEPVREIAKAKKVKAGAK